MPKQIMPTELLPGARLTVEIGGYTHDGRGVARAQGRVIFVAGAICGEQVEIAITGQQKKVLIGRLLKVIKPSPERTEPICPAYQGCGGCHLQHMSYAEELVFKEGQVTAALRRIGGLGESLAVQPIIAADELYHYRNKGVFHVIRDGGAVRLGFWDEGSHQPAADRCTLLFPPGINALTGWLQGEKLPPNISDIMLRQSFAGGDLLLAAVLTDENRAAALPLLTRASEAFPKLRVIATQTPGGWQTHSAATHLTDRLGDTAYQIAAPSFFQVNNRQTRKLLDTAARLLGDNCRVLLDAYCGIGTIGLYLAGSLPNLQRLIGIEMNESAVQNARANAKLNCVWQAEFYCGKAEALFDGLAERQRPDAVIVDPPRRGCHAALLKGLLKLQPPKILYVSCDPATLARDLAALTAGGYQPACVQPLDMFPRTRHVETVVLMSRKDT